MCAPRESNAQTEGPAGRDRYGLGFREEWFKIDCSVCSREGIDQYVPSLLPMNNASAISRNSDFGSNIGISSNVLRISRNQLMIELLRAPLLCSGITP